MVRLTTKGCKSVREVFHRARQRYDGQPFQRASTFRQAYLTDLLQEIVDQGGTVKAVPIQGNWIEVDTVEDYKYVQRVFKGTLP